jgi:3-methyladenine DNA glycosylase AlkD
MKTLHTYHNEILEEIEKHIADDSVPLERDGFRYIGTTKSVYFLRAADFRRIFIDFAKRHPDLTTTEFVALLDTLSLGKTYNEFAAVGLLLGVYPKLRVVLDPHSLDRWLAHAEGWAEVDVICQLNFTADEVLANWETWKDLLTAFAESENTCKRRASLVLLTKPLRESDDSRLADLAFANTDKLKGEKDKLIAKAVSWILRSLIKYHRTEVEQYLDVNAATLPRIAVRETRRKLTEGVKRRTPNMVDSVRNTA